MSILSEAHLDALPLFRLAYPTFTGHVGMVAPHGVTFVDGVAQNGVTAAASARLRGAIGPALIEVGPWEDKPVAAAPVVAAPSARLASSVSPPAPRAESTPAPVPPAGGASPSPRRGR